jgi:2,3-bisphosphoglycerate-independent phosphoglycerate mutase
MSYPRVCLIVLDGWGLGPPGPGNAVRIAHTPVFDELWKSYPHTQLIAMGVCVGLPEGQMGNSEVGHLNLGAGSIVPQSLARIDAACEDGALAENEALRDTVQGAPRVHLIGLVSPGGVHSSERHLKALVELFGEWGIEDVVIHAFTDGRDTLPTRGARSMRDVERFCKEIGTGRIGSVIGRYYAMDRDQRWDRIQLAYDLLVHGRGEHEAESGEAAVRAAYDRDETDEFITPTTVGEEARIRPGDAVVAFNFRPDRMRQLTRALAEEGFDEVDRGGAGLLERYATMTEYKEGWPYPVLFALLPPEVTLGRIIADRGLDQLHVAESEKYPHVTYFFNGGEGDPLPGEERDVVASPKDVPTYDHKPQMSAHEATEAFLREWEAGDYAFAIINFANPDMVGHTGNIPAVIRAVETVDACLGRVVEAVHAKGGACIVTADHGNADNMLERDGSPNTAHSLNPVPLIVTTPERPQVGVDSREGILADVAPTVLELLGFEQPEQMTGRSLLT